MNSSAYQFHIPVMLDEAIQAMKIEPGGRYIDCTTGAAGHAEAILRASAPGGQLLGLEADPKAVEIARKRLKPFGDSALVVNRNFSGMEEICLEKGYMPVHGILFDLGVSSMQLGPGSQGFSFLHEDHLDMRFDPRQELTVFEIVNSYPEKDIADIIYAYGEEPASRRIARAIVVNRPVRTTVELAGIVERATGGRKGRTHPATRTFQALRIAVNSELEMLKTAMVQAINLLGHGGRLVVISYHSLEDRIVKSIMQQEARNCVCPVDAPVCICSHRARLKLVSRKVITPGKEEIKANPRSRSARMRVAERIVPPSDSSLHPAGLFFIGLTGCLAGATSALNLN